MSVDSGVIRAEPHIEIGLLLQRDADVLVQCWSRRAIHEQPNAKRVHHQALVDHLHDFLQALGRSLSESGESGYSATLQHCLPATVHGEQRWETGWSLSEVVNDYGILRLVILDHLEETLDAPASLRALMAIGLALDEAIAASVIMYTNSRDSHQRQLEAERAESDRRVKEQLRQRAEALKEVDRRKNEFMAVLGHEMRNPLAPLSNVAHLLELGEPGGEALPKIRQIIQRQVDQLARLADDLLDTAGIAAGKIELRTERVNLVEIAELAVQTSRPHMDARGHHFEYLVHENPLWLQGDTARLLQIFGNLLNNAAKYTHHGGRITLVIDRDGDEAVVQVRDSGVGIPPDLLPHIFELFTQGEWSVNETRGGMGIGLALVRRLVELHRGTIEATSAGLNLGSEFEVRLPLLLEAPRAPTAPASRQQDSRIETLVASAPRRVLVVDDNADVANTLAMLLSLERHNVRVVHDGSLAVILAMDFRPDVIFLDLGLPHMDGYEVARRLREEQETNGALLVAVSGYARDEDRRRSKEAGFDLHLVKPVNLAELRSVLAHK